MSRAAAVLFSLSGRERLERDLVRIEPFERDVDWPEG